MALSGVHLTLSNWGPAASAALPAELLGSQTMAVAGTSTLVAPARCLLTVASSAAIYYAYGTAPDATTGRRRYYDPATASQREEVILQGGDKIAWIAA